MRHDVQASLMRYAEKRVAPGGFLTAVLENNLSEAVSRADSTNREDLCEIVTFVYRRLPVLCWGSPQRVRKWLGEGSR